MTSVSDLKRKYKQYEQMQKNKPNHTKSVQRILQRAMLDSFSMDAKFKNLQDPLTFIQNDDIKQLVTKTQQTSEKLRNDMEQISQFSKSTYKKIISRQGNQYSFQNLDQRYDTLQNNVDLNKIKFNNMKKIKALRGDKRAKQAQNQPMHQYNIQMIKKNIQRQFLHKLYDQQETNDDLSKPELNYQHIKLIDTPQFDLKCKHIQFYEYLKSQKPQNNRLYNQPFDIDTNNIIQRAINRLDFNIFEQDIQFGSLSQNLFFDFQNNLKFWKQIKQGNNDLQIQNKTDQQILSYCSKYDKKKPSVNFICDLAMRKITPETITAYFDIKRTHQAKIQMQKMNQNLDQKYNKLKKQFQYAKQMRLKAKTQRIPLKYIDTQSQTINRMKQKDFDNYFMQQIPDLLEKLGKLSKVRQRAMINQNTQKKIIVLKNTYYQIKQILFKLLILLLKGQKFYSNGSGAPYFSYSDLIDVQSRDQVQNKILELIYTKINQFKVDYVDGVPKGQILKIYVQERQKNDKILEIVDNQ